MMNSNDRRIYLAGARAFACVPILAIAGVAAGALLARGVPMLAKSPAAPAAESVSLPPNDSGHEIEPNLEASATSVDTTTPPSRPCRRPSHWRRAASLPASVQERVARGGSICEMRQLQMGPMGRMVRYCHF